MADAFRKDADRVAGRQRAIDGRERLGVLRHVNALIEPAIHGNGTRSPHQGTERTVEEGRFREKADVAPGGGPDHRGIEQRVGMIGQQQRRATRRRRTDAIDAVEQPRRRSGGKPHDCDQFQIPNSKGQRDSKLQKIQTSNYKSRALSSLSFVIWSGFGIWNLEFGIPQNVCLATHSRSSESTTTYRVPSRASRSSRISAESDACTVDAPPRRCLARASAESSSRPSSSPAARSVARWASVSRCHPASNIASCSPSSRRSVACRSSRPTLF